MLQGTFLGLIGLTPPTVFLLAADLLRSWV
jgi:hypothetical protein